ncbi:hypothetical protein HYG86_14095 [Alkalicella caledoniensis]|uniref:Uncharacterized protein n=1 Tax=Alkalicella caledoniensis TaxID=2731377 RepID=A0A7G9WAV3_ALKCA|nr:hypothetical protein [Alkalicella caledoniensis]QNO15815.1 hypothetical protein HYG86_14095 [Alkalicella caledoniensis]
MNFDLTQYDNIKNCPKCKEPIKSIKLSYIQKKIENITEDQLENLKLCSRCKRMNYTQD